MIKRLFSIVIVLVITMAPASAQVGTLIPFPKSYFTNGGTLPFYGLLVGGTDGTVGRWLSMDTSGRANVNINGTVPVSGTFWPTTQPVSATSLPLPTGAAQDSTLTGGSQQTKITDGTTVLNIAPATGSQTGQAYAQCGGTDQTQTYSITSATPTAGINVAGYATVNVQITALWTGSTPTISFQGSNDNTNFLALPLQQSPSVSAGPAGSTTAAGDFHGSLMGYKWFRLNATNYTSGTGTVVVEFKTLPDQVLVTTADAAQNGAWTIASNPTASGTGGYTYNHISTNTTTLVASGAHYLHSIVLNNPGSVETITVYDNTAASGTVLAVITPSSTTGPTYTFDAEVTTGIDIVSAGTTAADFTVTYK